MAVRAGVSEKTAGVFLNGLINQLIAGLKSDKQVKINGLGMFKLQAVAPRKSVNVSTGEEIRIEGYNKIVFLPEAGLKELVESLQPSAVSFQPSDVSSQPSEGDFPINPIQKLGEQADEIVGLLAELGQEPGKEEDERTNERTKEEDERTKDENERTKEEGTEEVVVEEPKVVVEEEPKAVVEEEPKVVVEEEPKAVVEEEPKAVVEEEPEIIVQRPKQEKKKHHFVRDVLICVLILLLLLAGGYFFLRSQLSGILESLMNPETEQTEQVEMVESEPLENPTPALPSGEGEEDPQIALIPEGDIPQEQILEEFNAISNDQGEEEEEDLLTTEPMHEGSRLTWMSKRYYGDKRFWPYIYDANRDRIHNPNKIEVGTPIRVPRLTRAQMDTTNSASMEALERLRIEAEAACRK